MENQSFEISNRFALCPYKVLCEVDKEDCDGLNVTQYCPFNPEIACNYACSKNRICMNGFKTECTQISTLKAQLAILEDYLNQNERTAHMFFWDTQPTSAGRDKFDEKESRCINMTVTLVTLTPKIKKVKIMSYMIEATINVESSCKNIYVKKSVSVNGKDADSRNIRSIANKIRALLPSESE